MESAEPLAFQVWVDNHDLSVKELADELGVHWDTIYKLRRGDYPPGANLRLRIAKLSNGKVPFDSWGDDDA